MYIDLIVHTIPSEDLQSGATASEFPKNIEKIRIDETNVNYQPYVIKREIVYDNIPKALFLPKQLVVFHQVKYTSLRPIKRFSHNRKIYASDYQI